MTGEFGIAVHAIVYLNHKGDCQSSEKIAENVCCNPARIRKVLSKLKKASLIQTKEGLDGGCFFTGNPEEINLDMICRAVGEFPISVSKKTGDSDMECLIASGMADIMNGIYSKMNQACLDSLKNITVKDIDEMIFKPSEPLEKEKEV